MSIEDPSDLIKRVTASTLKAIAGVQDEEVNITYSSAPPSINGLDIKMPNPDPILGKKEIENYRGLSDSLGVRLRYNNEMVHKKYMPSGKDAQAVYETIEQARCESLGSNRLIGVANNLSAILDEKCQKKGYNDITEKVDSMLPDVIGILVREQLTGKKPPKNAQKLVFEGR